MNGKKMKSNKQGQVDVRELGKNYLNKDLPNNFLNALSGYTRNKNLASLSRTSKTMHKITQPHVKVRKEAMQLRKDISKQVETLHKSINIVVGLIDRTITPEKFQALDKIMQSHHVHESFDEYDTTDLKVIKKLYENAAKIPVNNNDLKNTLIEIHGDIIQMFLNSNRKYNYYNSNRNSNSNSNRNCNNRKNCYSPPYSPRSPLYLPNTLSYEWNAPN